MKKIFTLAAAVLASFSLWAQDADIAIDAMTEADSATYFKSYGDATVLCVGTYQQTGSYYNVKADQTNNSAYVGVTSSKELAKVAFLVTGNGKNKNINAGLVGYKQVAETPDFTQVDYATYVSPSVSIAAANYSDAQWVEFDLTDLELKAVYFAKQWKNVVAGTSASASYPSGNAQSLFVYGIRVWYAGESVSYAATYKANNGTTEADSVNAAAKKVADNMFTAPEGFKFAGWNTAADGTGDAYEVGAALTADVTLFAQWVAVCYDDVFDLAGGIGTAEVTASDASINENGHLVLSNSAGRITLSVEGGFKAGDIIEMAGTIGNNSKKWGVIINGKQTLSVAGTDCQLTGVLASDAETLALGRADGTTTTITSLVIKRETVCKEIQSTLVELTDVKINGVSLEASQLAALKENNTLALETEYVVAPTIVFVATTTVTYVDETTKVTSENLEVVAEENAEEKWEASQIVNVNTYTITAVKPNSFTITYKDGETVLGEEVVKVGEDAAKQADYEAKQLATFLGWFTDAELTLAVESWTVTANRVVYGKWEDAYATSYNFEKAVMENGKAYDFLSQLGAQHYATNITGSLDSLDNSKKDSLRNYAYLGLKVKQSGALLNFRLAAGNTVKIKFGNVAKTPKASINGGDYADITITDKVYTYTAEAEALVSIKTMDGNAVVFQQIMIGEDLQAPELFTITCAEAEHGTVSAPYKLGIPGEEFKLSFTMDEGYAVASCYANDVEIVGIPNVGEFFTMPAENVTITATFADAATAIDNTNAETKAVKVIRNGQLIIVRDGVEFNAQGAIVK